jgi:hypothetical protein
MSTVLNDIVNFVKPLSIYIFGGLIGSIVHSLRTKMTVVEFIKTAIIGMFVSVCIGIFFKEYMEITNQNVLFAICGIGGAFSRIILDELEPFVKIFANFIKNKFTNKQ